MIPELFRLEEYYIVDVHPIYPLFFLYHSFITTIHSFSVNRCKGLENALPESA